MFHYNQDYEPYLRNGLLCFPEKTVRILIRAGLNEQVADLARRGLKIEDSADLGRISTSLGQLLYQIQARGWTFQGWDADDISLLTGKKPLND